MAKFPEEMSFVLVEDAFQHYDIALFELVETVYVYCEWCDAVIATFTYEEVVGMNRDELYVAIIEKHSVSELV